MLLSPVSSYLINRVPHVFNVPTQKILLNLKFNKRCTKTHYETNILLESQTITKHNLAPPFGTNPHTSNGDISCCTRNYKLCNGTQA